MGVLNVTPDSFYDGGRYAGPVSAERRALEMEREGADLIDVGGESSRPGAASVSAAEEIRRVRPVVRRLKRSVKIPVSVDTRKAEVAHAALDEGASVINDISALGDRRMARLAARYGAGLVLMHMRGDPSTMQKNPVYKNLIADILAYLRRAAGRALEDGVERDRIVVDPGFGFGKTAAHNFELLARLDEFAALKLPVLVGLSRKSFIGHALGGAPADERLHGSVAAAAIAIRNGAHILRVHDVLPHAQTARLVDHV